jgi:hypothetical protein
MSYTPNNLTVFTAGYAGAFAGLAAGGRQPRDILTGDYTSYALVAVAFAECLDGVWGSGSADTLEVFNLLLTSYGVFDARNPGVSSQSLNRGTYLALATAIVSAVTESETVVTGLGVTPAPWPGGGASTLEGQAFGPLDATLLQRTAIQGPDIFVDPSNETGHASDSNDGLSEGEPILTTDFLNSNFLFFRFGTANIHYLSDDPSGISPQWDTFSGELTFLSTPQVLHTGGTLNAGTTAINPPAGGGGQRQTAHTSDLGTFAPYLPDTVSAKFITDTVTGARSWIVSGAATASVSPPTLTEGTTQGALTIGDGYTISRGSILAVNCTAPQVATFQGFALSECFGNEISLVQCSISDRDSTSGTFIDCVDCYVNNIQGEFSFDAGVWIVGNFDFSPIVTIQNDTYVTGRQVILGEANIQAIQIIGRGNFSPPTYGYGAQFQDMVTSQAIAVYQDTQLRTFGTLGGAEGLLWGNGNTGIGMLFGANTYASKDVPPTVTGADGDFGFLEPSGTVQVARAWVEATASWTDPGAPPSRATTWANWATAIGGGGFGFAAQDVSANVALIGT